MTRRAVIALVVVLLFVGCYRAPNAPVVPSGPSVVAKDTFVMFSSAATDPDGDDVCIRFDWGDADTSDWSRYVASGESVSMRHAWSAVGACSVRAQASDVTGGPSEWSPALPVQVAEWHAPHAPSVPSGSRQVMKDSPARFSSSATDPDSDSVCVRFAWGDGDTSGWSQVVVSGESVAMTHSWVTVGFRLLRAQAKDQKDLISVWSAACTVSIRENHAPNTPSVPSGPTAVTRESLASYSSAATDPDNDSVCIRIDWGDGDTSDWSQVAASGESAAMTHCWDAVGVRLLRAQAKDQNGLVSMWSAACSVSISENHAPNTPSVPSGPTAVKRDSLASYSSAATDPDNDSVSIRFDWGDGDTSDWTCYVQSGASISDTHRWSYPDTYEVRVQAKDACGAPSGWSGPLGVVVSGVPPDRAKWVYRYPNAECVSIGSALARDASGNVYVAGWRYGAGTGDDIIVISLSSDGDTNWTYVYNGPGNGNDRAEAIVCGADGNLYVAGVSEGAGTHNDFTVISIDVNGGQRWVYTRSGQMSGYYNDFASAVIYGGDGNIYACGCLCEYGYEDYVVISLTSLGSERWAYIEDISSWDTARGLVWGADGNIYVTGWSRGPGGSLDFRLVGLRPSGSEKWVYTYQQSGGDDRGSFIAYGPDHNLYTAGYTKPGGAQDAILISVDTLGQLRWIRTYNGPGNGDDEARPIVVASDAGVCAAGRARRSGNQDMLLLSMDASGNQNWASLFNGPGNSEDDLFALVCAPAGGLYAAGYSTGVGTGRDLTVLSQTSAGDTTWTYRYHGSGNGADAGYSLVNGSAGDLYVAGVSRGTDTTDIVVISLTTAARISDRGLAVPAVPRRVTRSSAEFQGKPAPSRPKAVPVRAKGAMIR
jgi:hypothetical protein